MPSVLVKSKIRYFLGTKIDLSSMDRRVSMSLVTPFVAFLLLLLFEPFGIYHNPLVSQNQVLFELLVAITFVFAVLIVSLLVLRPAFGQLRLNVLQHIGWFLLESIIVTSIWTFLDELTEPKASLISLWVENWTFYLALLILPYFLCLIYFHLKGEKSPNGLRHTDSSGHTQTENNPISETKVMIQDESGDIQLILLLKDLLFLKSADNYVEVNYIEGDRLAKKLVRNTLKKLETKLIELPVIRCHRSFMVHLTNISLVKKSPSGFELKMNGPCGEMIPVSKSYISELKKRINFET